MQDTQCFCIEYISTPPTHTHTHGYMFLPNPSSTIPSAKGKKALITSLLSSSQKLALKNTKFAITQASIISLTDPISQDLDYLVNLIPSTLPTKVHIINSVQSLSHVWHFATPWTSAPRPTYPSPTPGVHPNSCPLSWWCHPTISSSVVPFSSCPQSFPASGSFQMS